MRRIFIALALALVASPALAGETPSDGFDAVAQSAIRSLGRVNINLATRQELLNVGLDAVTVERVLRDRARRPIADLTAFSPAVRRHLKTDGVSDFRRIRQLPLERIEIPSNTTLTASR
jgi:hypothetical protein